jgi:hypothetical protein
MLMLPSLLAQNPRLAGHRPIDDVGAEAIDRDFGHG